MKRDWFKYSTYFAIAAGTSILSATTLDWRAFVASAVAGFVAIKALDSNPNKKETK